MSFTKNRYLKWYIPRLSPSAGTINLHSSGMPAVPAEELEAPTPTGYEMIGLAEEALANVLQIPKEELLFTSGATGGTLLALLTLGRPGGNFVVETPIYEPMMQQARRLGEVRVLPRSFDEQWRVDPERARALIDEETDVVLITEPHNPSGLFSPRDNLLILADICRDKGAYLLINEVYLGYSTRKSFHNLAGNVLIVNSYSKLLGSYSNRIGWVSGSKETVGRLRQANLNMGGGSVPSAAVGIGFAKQAVRRTQMARDASAKWVDVVDDWVKHNPDLQWFRPEGPGFGAVSLPRGIDDLAFVNHLYEQKNVLAIPGSLFFSPGTIRVSWLNVGDRLEEGLDSITATLKERS